MGGGIREKSKFNYSGLPHYSDDLSDEDFDQPTRACPYRIPFRHLALGTISLPLGGFIFCVIWALCIDFDSATYTHCNVTNYLPSLSAATGGFPLSKRVWRNCIGLHAVPRFLVVFMYNGYLHSVLKSRYGAFINWVSLFSILENLGLLGLTFVSSKENYRIHQNSFIMFLVASELHMVFMCVLLSYARNIPATSLEAKSLKVKWRLVCANLASSALACYVFVRHNTYCEPGMYTIFSFLEYLVVFTNMGFHMSAYMDFYDRYLTICPC